MKIELTTRFSLPLIIVCLGLKYCCAQTYIGASIGVDYSKIEEQYNSVGFRILESGFEHRSMLLGIRVEKPVLNSFFVSLQSQYSSKKVGATDRGFVPFKGLEIKNIRSSLQLNWMPITSLSFGAGFSCNYIIDISKIRAGNSNEKMSGKVKEAGIGLSIGYIYKHFLIEFDYINGLGIIGLDEESKIIKPIDTFGVSIHYMIKVLEKRKGSKVNCPRL